MSTDGLLSVNPLVPRHQHQRVHDDATCHLVKRSGAQAGFAKPVRVPLDPARVLLHSRFVHEGKLGAPAATGGRVMLSLSAWLSLLRLA